MRLLQLIFAVAFLGWCFYGGVYLPAQHGAYGNDVEQDRGDEDSGVGQDNVGEYLED